jgi:hypothetical protein
MRSSLFQWASLRAIFLAIGLCILVSCGDDNGDDIGPLHGGDKGDGDFNPNQGITKLDRIHVSNTFDVRFVVIGDPHFAAHRDWGVWKSDKKLGHGIGPLRAISSDINDECHDLKKDGPECAGVVLVGDLTKGDYWNHSLLMYRSLYEHDKTFGKDPYGENYDDDEMPSNDQKIKYPVFLTLGNHDDATERQETYRVREYVRMRIHDSDALFDGVDAGGNKISNYQESHGGDIYAWEWGNFHFIMGSLWMFYGYYDGNAQPKRRHEDWAKVDWLKDHLRAIGKEKPIVLFQHFGWDSSFSFDDDNNWWSHKCAEEVVDVICDREVVEGNNESCDSPYNVVAVFSGHTHAFGTNTIWLDDARTKSIPNYVVDDAGHDNDQAGYFYVRLQIKDGATGKGTLTGTAKHFHDGTNDEDWYGYNQSWHEDWGERDFQSTLFLRFDQGEPNSGGGHAEEDCAAIKSNGRYFDAQCDREYPVVCVVDAERKVWHLSSASYTWDTGKPHCRSYGQEFAEPRNIEEQMALMSVMRDAGVDKAWINYTDQYEEGKWEEER